MAKELRFFKRMIIVKYPGTKAQCERVVATGDHGG